jgi:hypothetical protein
MNKLLLFFIGLVFIVTSCNTGAVEKPNNLLDEDKMVDIIYDLSLLDALRNQGSFSQKKYPSSTEFLKQKYKIDSLTFAKNSLYYASDLKKYKRIYDDVKKRLDAESKKANGNKKENLPDVGVVK